VRADERTRTADLLITSEQVSRLLRFSLTLFVSYLSDSSISGSPPSVAEKRTSEARCIWNEYEDARAVGPTHGLATLFNVEPVASRR
jgi:hypothetical protein